MGFDGLIYRMGGADDLYGNVARVTDGDTLTVEAQGQTTPVRLIGVDTPETVAPDQPVGCFGKEASDHTRKVLYELQTDTEGKILREGRLVKLEIPRVGDSEDAYGRTLAYVWIDASEAGDGTYETLFNEDLVRQGLARTTTFSHARRREFERELEATKEAIAGLWGTCSGAESY